jgi:hypothetical protein
MDTASPEDDVLVPIWWKGDGGYRRRGAGHEFKTEMTINMAPYLRRIWLGPSDCGPRGYPFCLPFLGDDFELNFDRPITIIVGENGTGKSTLLEGIAVLAGYDEAGGGKGYMPVDHSDALEKMGGELSKAFRAGWLPKISNGWFFRAESFFSVARYLDTAARDAGKTPLPFPFARRRLFSLLRGALPKPGHLHLRRAGIGAVARAPAGIPETDAADGDVHDLPGRDGDAFADAHGLSRREAAAADEVWTGAGDCGGDGPLQGHAGVLR